MISYLKKSYLVRARAHTHMCVCGRFVLTNIFSTTTHCRSVGLNLTILNFFKFYFEISTKKPKVVFGWQHLDLDLKSMDLIKMP